MRIFSPAKLNLFLAVTGKAAGGYHELLSLAVPLDFGDTLEVERRGEGATEDELTCADPRVPTDGSNLVRRAAAAFREGLRERGGGRADGPFFRFALEKRIPPGGGLGGGSGNAVAALRAMNRLEGEPLAEEDLAALAAGLGADCPLFLPGGPVVFRGRGERVEARPELAGLLRPWRIFLVDPGFAVPTGPLFTRWAAAVREGRRREEAGEAERALARGLEELRHGDPGPLLRNDLGGLLREKYLFYDVVEAAVRAAAAGWLGITGSGSVAFVLLHREADEGPFREVERELFGEPGFSVEAAVLPGKDC